MKIDAEGAELDVLRGAYDTISSHRPTILIEVHWLGRPFVDYVNETLAPMGYTARTLDGGELPTDAARFHAVLRPE
jgi:Methyltransferase FkbM domain